MSTDQGAGNGADVTTTASSASSLPELTDRRIDEIETALFADISHERAARRARRGRWWIGGAAAAAVIVVAAIIAPSVAGLVGGIGGVSYSDESAVAPAVGAPDMAGGGDSGAVTDEAVRSGLDGASQLYSEDATGEREIITNASATVVVDDIPATARTIGEAAEARDGYVESMSIGQSGAYYPVDPNTGIAYDDLRYPYTPDGAWITVRVPADELSGMVRELSALGDVTASSINRQDVTEQAVDLRARIEAAEASVDRLTELMSQATSVADLIAAESALAERQATLESYQAQLKSLESYVAMSSLTVTLQPEFVPVEADPAGFADGLIAGWNGLVATLNGIVVAIGFLIPWIAVIAIAGFIVWGIVRLVRRRRKARAAVAAPATPEPESEPASSEE